MPLTPRLIPVLLLRGTGFYKTTGFAAPRYLGDPLNIVRLFDEKEADELCILDIQATQEGRGPRFEALEALADECFMPLSYGGGLRSVEECRRVLAIGFEKVVLNSALTEEPALVSSIAAMAGSQAVVASIDARCEPGGGWRVWSHAGSRPTGWEPVAWARHLAERGAGEILLTSIDQDGAMAGYDLELIRAVADAVPVPVVACGGAGSMADLVAGVIDGHASAVAAGSLFVFYGRRRAVLINPPSSEEFEVALTQARR